MARFLKAPFALRARRPAAWIVPAVVVLALAGCNGHRRASMRPVYVAPAAPCASGNCGGTVLPSAPAGSATISPSSKSSSTVISEPSLVEPGSAPGASVSDVAPLSNSNTTPPVTPPLPAAPKGGPALEGPVNEPGLDEPVPSAAPAPKDSGVGGTGANSSAPGTSFKNTNTNTNTNAGRTANGRVRQASLSERVKPYVNEPSDLFAPPKADRPWKYIVLHHSANENGAYDSIDKEHRERLGWQGCGYHFIIGNGSESPDGQIEVARRWTDQKHGVHCRDGKNSDVNEYGIGICLVGDLEKSPPTAKQIAAARALVAYLSARYQIADDHTETHAHLAASPTSCPGRLFPTQAILGASARTVR